MDFPTAPVVGQRHPFTPTPGVPVFIWDGEKWTADPLTGAVRYDAAQSLTAPQQAQARDNIAVTSGAPFDALAYSGMQINGGMEVSQEKGFDNAITGFGYSCDGWVFDKNGTLAVSASDAVTGTTFTGFSNALVLVTFTAQTTMASGDYCLIYQPIEGYRIMRLAWGTANAQPITIGFWSKHFRAGLYSGTICNSPVTRSYAFTYTQTVSDVAQYNVITIPGCTDGTWAATNGVGLRLMFSVAAGSTYTAPSANTWVTGNYFAAPGQINGVAATTDRFRITGVVVLPGTQAPTAAQSPNIMRPYTEELKICERYFERCDGMSFAFYTIAGYGLFVPCSFRTTKRAVPTMGGTSFGSVTNATGASYNTVTTHGFTFVYAAIATGNAVVSDLSVLADARL